VGSDVDNLDRPNARDPSATARRERAYKFGQAQRARGVQLFGHPSSTVLRDAEADTTDERDEAIRGVMLAYQHAVHDFGDENIAEVGVRAQHQDEPRP